MSAALYDRMLIAVRGQLRLLGAFEGLDLVSGGAAWADHLAVTLWLEGGFRSLHLYLPTTLEALPWGGRWMFDAASYEGEISNYYHRKFSAHLRRDTLKELGELTGQVGVVLEVVHGFKQRNSRVAQVDTVIALTWGKGEVPKDGGTKDTWDKAHAATRIHIPLSTFVEVE